MAQFARTRTAKPFLNNKRASTRTVVCFIRARNYRWTKKKNFNGKNNRRTVAYGTVSFLLYRSSSVHTRGGAGGEISVWFSLLARHRSGESSALYKTNKTLFYHNFIVIVVIYKHANTNLLYPAAFLPSIRYRSYRDASERRAVFRFEETVKTVVVCTRY